MGREVQRFWEENQNKLYQNIFNLKTKEIKDMLSGCILNIYVCTLLLILSSTLASSLKFTQRLITLTVFQWVILSWESWNLKGILVYISLITSKVVHFCVSSFKDYWFMCRLFGFASCSDGYFSSLYNLHINPLSDV